MSLINQMLNDLDEKHARSIVGSCLCQRGDAPDAMTLGIPNENGLVVNRYSSATVALVFAGVVPGSVTHLLPVPELNLLSLESPVAPDSRYDDKGQNVPCPLRSDEGPKGDCSANSSMDASSMKDTNDSVAEFDNAAFPNSSLTDCDEPQPQSAHNEIQPELAKVILPRYISPVRRSGSVVASHSEDQGGRHFRLSSLPVDKSTEASQMHSYSVEDAGATLQSALEASSESDDDASFISVVQRPLSVEQQISNDWRLAVQTYRKGDYEEAERLLRDLLFRDEGLHEARLLLARIHVQQNRSGQAETVLADGVQHGPLHAPSVVFLARILADQGRDKAAIDTLQTAISGAHENAELHALLAALYQRSGKPVAASRSYLVALSLEPSHGEWWVGLGISSEEAGDVNTANTAYSEAAQHPMSNEVEKYAEGRLQQLLANRIVDSTQD